MQNFYELENLIEKKKLDEVEFKPGIDYSHTADYAQKRPSDPNPDLQSVEDAEAAVAADKRANISAQEKIGIQALAGRRGGKAGDVIRTTQNDIRMKLGEMGTPESINALKLQAVLFEPQYFGKTFELPEFLKIVMRKTKMDVTDIKGAIKLLRQVAGNHIQVIKGTPYPKIKIVDPFTLGGAGSTPEALDVDAEDIRTATGGAKIADRPTIPRTVTAGPQKLAPQEGDKWKEIEIRANQALQKYSIGTEIPDPEEIKSVVNDLKAIASEYPEKTDEIKGFIGELEAIVPQREWFEIFESMCQNGI